MKQSDDYLETCKQKGKGQRKLIKGVLIFEYLLNYIGKLAIVSAAKNMTLK
jgi:hypothetical protein